MKKILHIQLYCKMSGVQKISYELLKGLGDDYDKTIAFSREECIGNRDETVKLFQDIGVNVIFLDNLTHQINLIKDIKSLKEIFILCKTNQYDIVHTNSSKPGVVGRIAAKLAGIPMVVHTVHGISFNATMPLLKQFFYYFCELFASFFCDKIVLVNKFYIKYYLYCRKKVETIYNAIDYKSLSANKKKNDGVSVNFLYVGRLDKQKNPIYMLEAFYRARQINKNILLTIVGDGELLDQCKCFIKIFNLEDCVFIEGWKTNIDEYYSKSDVFISTPLYEAFGLTFLEAGYYELPVIATSVEGIPEVVRNNKTGLLCAPNEVDDVAHCILMLASDAKMRETLGKNAKKYVTAQFTIDDMRYKYKRIYESL